MSVIECTSVEKLSDIQNMPLYRYTFESKEIPKLILIAKVATAYTVGKTYTLEIA